MTCTSCSARLTSNADRALIHLRIAVALFAVAMAFLRPWLGWPKADLTLLALGICAGLLLFWYLFQYRRIYVREET